MAWCTDNASMLRIILLTLELLAATTLCIQPPRALGALGVCSQEKSDVEPELPDALATAREQLVNLACELAQLQAAAGLPVSEEDYLREVLHPGLMQVGAAIGGWCCSSCQHQ
jgi:hypothetical protein